MIHIRSTEKNHISHVTRHKRRLLWILIISLAVLWMATACETAPEHPAVGDTTPSAEATNAYSDTETTGNPDTAQTEKPSQTAPQTTAPAVTQDPVMELTPEQIRDEILTWDGVADFQDGTIYTTFTQLSGSEFQNVQQFYNIVDQIQKRDFEDDVKHIKIGEVVIDMACADADNGFGTIMNNDYCITAVAARGQKISLESHPLSLCYPNGFYILETGDITLIGHGPHTGNWWFINDSGFVTDLREGISEYSREGYVYHYYYDDNNILCYSRFPKKFMLIQDDRGYVDCSTSLDDLYSERGTVTFDADGNPGYTVVSKTKVGESDNLQDAINYYKNEGTLDELFAHNAAIYEPIK